MEPQQCIHILKEPPQNNTAWLKKGLEESKQTLPFYVMR